MNTACINKINPNDQNHISALFIKGYRTKEGIRYACGGALINRRYVVTAAHCNNKRIARVVLGEHDFSKDPDCLGGNECAKPVQRFTISSRDVIVHENYNRLKVVTEANDIALVRLPKAAYTIDEIVATSVLPICLPWGPLPNGKVAKLPSGK